MFAIPGAAKYSASTDPFTGKHQVWMDDGGCMSVIDSHPSIESARKAAAKWQAKENAAVAKARK